jgi:hypothetical protein
MPMQHGPFLLLLVMGSTSWPFKSYAKLVLLAGFLEKIHLSRLLCSGWSIVRLPHSLDKVFVLPTTSTSLATRFLWHSTSKLIAAALTTSWRLLAYHEPKLPLRNPWRPLSWMHSAMETKSHLSLQAVLVLWYVSWFCLGLNDPKFYAISAVYVL